MRTLARALATALEAGGTRAGGADAIDAASASKSIMAAWLRPDQAKRALHFPPERAMFDCRPTRNFRPDE